MKSDIQKIILVWKSLRERIPFLHLFLSGLLSLLSIGLLSWVSVQSYKTIVSAHDRHLKIKVLQGSIIHLDEVLTMSARMSAASGEAVWEDRYYHFSSKLDADIADLIKIAPSSAAVEFSKKTQDANDKLVAMEEKSFLLTRNHRRIDAMAVLSSKDYEVQKKIYSSGIESLNLELNKMVQLEQSAEAEKLYQTIGACILLLFFFVRDSVDFDKSFYSWSPCFDSTNRQQTTCW